MKNKKHLLYIFLLILGLSTVTFINNINATTGSVRGYTIGSCGNIRYGAHGSPLHWHIINGTEHALPSQGQWSSEASLRKDLCKDTVASTKSSNTNIESIQLNINDYKDSFINPLDCEYTDNDLCDIENFEGNVYHTISDKVNIKVKLEDSKASYKISNPNLKLGSNDVKIVVTAQNKSTKTYVIKIIRLDNNLDIKNFKINDKDYSNIDTFETEDIDLTLQLTPVEESVTLEYDTTISLDYGDNEFIVKATNKWGISKEYKYNLVRIKSSNTNIKSITYVLDPSKVECHGNLKTYNQFFGICDSDYSEDLSIVMAVDYLDVIVELENDKSTYTLSNNRYLPNGENDVLVNVQAENGTIVSRPIKVIHKDNNSHLSRFGLIDNKSVDFNEIYQTENKTLNLSITPQSQSTQIKYNENVVLALGDNYIPIKTLTEFGQENIHYIHIERLPISNNDATLVLNNKNVVMAHCKDENLCYSNTIDVPLNTQSLDQLGFDIKLADDSATYHVNTMNLHRGINNIKVNVTAQNNDTNQMVLVINRELPPLKTSHFIITGVLGIGFIFTSALIIYNKEYWLYH